MTEQAIDPAVVARVRKLLNLSKNDAASENEREQSATHAQRLMMEHNISVAMVEASNETSTVAKRQKNTHVGNAMYEWQRGLMFSIATTCFVTVTSTTGRNQWNQRVKSYVLVGREENVISCQLLFDYLRQAIDRLAREYAGAGRAFSNEASSFKKGCAARLGDRLLERHRKALAEQKAQAQQASAKSGLPALIMEDFAEMEACANEDFRLGLAQGTTAHLKFVYARKSDALNAVWDVFCTKEWQEVEDHETLNQKADEIAMEKIAAAGLTPAETKSALEYARNAVHWHVQEAAHRKNPKKHRSVYRSYRRASAGSRDNTNYSAFNAGSDAGSRVSLDRQAAHSPLKQIG